MRRILLVDDSAIFRRSLCALLSSTSEWEVCGEAGNGEEGLKLAGELRPDAVVVDLSMPGCGGVETTRAIRRALEETKIVVLSLHHSKQIAEVVLEAGANAYVQKTSVNRDLIDALNAALANRTYISQSLERKLAKPA